MTPKRWIVTSAGIAPLGGVPNRFLLGGVWMDDRIGGEVGVARLAHHGVVLAELPAPLPEIASAQPTAAAVEHGKPRGPKAKNTPRG